MHPTRRILALSLALLCAFSLSTCGASASVYSKSESWAGLPDELKHDIDLFYLAPTAYAGDAGNFNMPLTDRSAKASFLSLVDMQMGIYSETCDVYAPYYAQAALSAYELPEAEREEYLSIAYRSVKQAFEYYMANHNDGRPIVLAGFSQGADMALRLLEDCFANARYQSKLVAAYIIGAAVTKDALAQYPHLKMAECATDLGCIVSFNCEAEGVKSTLMVPEETVGINPLSWTTDSTAADASLNAGACFTDGGGSIVSEIPEFCGAYLDAQRGTLKVTGVSPDDFPSTSPLFVTGDYHIYGCQFFYRNLQQNVSARAQQYMALSFLKENYAKPAETVKKGEAESKSEYLITVDRVPEEMLSAQYWIDKCSEPNELIMTQEEIAQCDFLSRELYRDFSEPDSKRSISGEELTELLQQLPIPTAAMYLDGAPVESDYWGAVDALRNLAGVREQNDVRYGICLARTGVRVLPTVDALSASGQLRFYDEMQNSSILYNEPVVILHASDDGQWLYVLTSYCSGWMRAQDIALCRDYEQWRSAQDFDAFLVVTGDKIRLEYDPKDSVASELELSMGVKLALVPAADFTATAEGRQAANCYAAALPSRDPEGMYTTHYAFVPASADVHVGYLPYTRENVLTLAFKSLGARYGWGGMYNARDCSQYVMDIYRCFGFMLPRNTYAQSWMPCRSLELNGLDDESKRTLLDAVPPGALLLFDGHVMLYLGEADGLYYVISAAAVLDPSGSAKSEVKQYQSVMVNDLSVTRRSGLSWLECLSDVKIIWED